MTEAAESRAACVDNDVLSEMAAKCRDEFAPRIQGLIPRVMTTDEAAMMQLLQLNDSLLAALAAHARVSTRGPTRTTAAVASTPHPAASSLLPEAVGQADG